MASPSDTGRTLGQRLPPGAQDISITDIDRRNAQRVVPMKLLCLGLSRTGTASLRQALFDLGYSDVYHYTSLISENPKDAELWMEAMKAKYYGIGKPYGRKEWDALLGHCMAVTDTPGIMFHKELLAAYPEAKVILTVRDNADVWHASFVETIQPFLDWHHGTTTGIYEYLCRWFLPKTPFWQVNEILSRHFMYPDMRNTGAIWYQGYNDEIKRLVPQDKLLVFNCKEGWVPLCKFLGQEIPVLEFPKTNEREVIKKNIGMIQTVSTRIIHKKMWRAAGVLSAVGAGMAALMYARPLQLW